MKIRINGLDTCDFDERTWIIGARKGFPEVPSTEFQDDWEAVLVLNELMHDDGYQQVDVIEP